MADALNREVAAAVAQGGTVKYHDDTRAVVELVVKRGAWADLVGITAGVLLALFAAAAFGALLPLLFALILGAVAGFVLYRVVTRPSVATWELWEDEGRVLQRQA